MADVFISYAPDDDRRVGPVRDALKARGWSTVLAHGENRAAAVDDALRRARCVVVLWSRSSIVDGRVRHDAGIAKFRHILVPALLDHELGGDAIPAVYRDVQAVRIVSTDDPRALDFAPLAASVAEVLAKRRRIGERLALATVAVALGLLGYRERGYLDMLVNAHRADLDRLEYQKFTTGENDRLAEALGNAHSIKLLLPNANSFVKTFNGELETFFARPDAVMRVLFATPDSAFYTEMTQMTFGPDWNEEKRGAAVESNKQRVFVSRQKLQSLGGNDPRKLQVRYFDTQFRAPIIIVDDKQCFLTVRLSPDEGAQSLRLEFEGDAGYEQSCVRHFDAMWNLSADAPASP